MLPVPLLELIPQYVPPDTDAGEAAVARIAYGERLPDAVFVPNAQLGPDPLMEVWQTADVFFGAVRADETRALEDLSHDLYRGMIAHVRKAGYPYFLRMWNYVGGINEIENGRERYQTFCAGRHDAFVEAGYHHDVDLPAASAVGMPGRGLITYFLAAKQAGVQIENPRQVAAYRYPKQYGPKSPSFSRATLWGETLFVSGTSSVIGHETAHRGDAAAQLDETLRNIEIVLEQANMAMANVAAAKTYVRRRGDYELIASRLDGVFPSNLFLEADICRADLLLEIECIAKR